MKTLEVTLPPLHEAQLAIDEHPARFKVVNCGRRFGKTALGVRAAIRVAVDGGFAWWVAPTYPIAGIGWDVLKHYARQFPDGMCSVKEADRLVTFPGGGAVQVKSADNPDSLRGRGLDYVVLDEAAYIPERAWTEALRPALSDRKGGALFISTPSGRNWFYRLYMRGMDGGLWGEWASFCFPTSANPYIDALEIEAARLELPAEVFAQEYEAAFTDDAGMVFRGVRECIGVGDAVGRIVAGLDWAQSKDYTALALVDDAGQVVALDRFNQIGWQVQRDRVMATVQRYGVDEIVAEYNSIGGPNIEELQAAGLPVTAFNTSNESKTRVIQQLVGAFERREIRIPNDPVLIGELEAYEAKRLPSGKWQYNAPEGMHDDTVIALALAWEARLAQGRYVVTVSDNPFF